MDNATVFINDVLDFIKEKDPLHYKKTKVNVDNNRKSNDREFFEFLTLLYNFFSLRKISANEAAASYLKMINDMRIEGLYFNKQGHYSCKTQRDAYIKVYSNPAVMSYYMDALLLSQILWTHHFKMLIYFQKMLAQPAFKSKRSVLDIGPGHGFFSYLTLRELPDLGKIDIVDISDSSLAMTKTIIGDGGGKISYYNRDVFDYGTIEKYDLIILGEVLEHLDEPLLILQQLSKLLTENGHLWITTPTNAPALDHVYLFRSKRDIEDLLVKAKFTIVDSHGMYAEDVKPEIAEKFKVSYLYGALLKNDLP
jgi:2-polyprenyl-3-methyl-5-hydroxy-6-metoxy-1,4-benzoquinol methylase